MLLHGDPVLEILGDVLILELRGQDPVDDVAGERHVELGEEFRRLERVADDHLLRGEDEEEGRHFLVGEDPRGLIDPLLDVEEFVQDGVLVELLLVSADYRGHLVVLPHLLPEPRDIVDPAVVDRGHAEVIERMAQGDQIVDVVVVPSLDNDVHHLVEDRALLHRRLRRRRLDVAFDLLRDFVHPVHVEDLLADLLLVRLHPLVRVDLLGVEVGYDFRGALPEDVLFENVAERRLGIDGKNEDLLPLLREVISRCRRKSGLAEAAFASEHDVSPVRVLLKYRCKRYNNHLLLYIVGDRFEICFQDPMPGRPSDPFPGASAASTWRSAVPRRAEAAANSTGGGWGRQACPPS